MLSTIVFWRLIVLSIVLLQWIVSGADQYEDIESPCKC